jgi:hypothetical protein
MSNRQVVFVDPDDDTQQYWWPAMLIPPTEYQRFEKQKITIPKENEILVCYFEDGSLYGCLT